MPSVSVIIPTFNRRELVCRAIESVLTQTRHADEIVLIDDGSADGTREEIEARFPSVKYEWQENRGVSAARNRGIKSSLGEWIALLDSDDEWLPEKLEAQFAALDAEPKYRVCHTDEIWIRRGMHVNPMKKHAKSGGRIFQRCLPLCAISPSSVLIHRSIFEEVGPFDESLPVCEDYDLWLRICAIHPVLYIDRPLLRKFGGHEDQLSRRYSGMDRFRVESIERLLHSTDLRDEDRLAAISTAIEKATVYAQGARKRGRIEEAERFEGKIESFLQMRAAENSPV